MENSIDSKFGGDYVVKDLTSLPEKLEWTHSSWEIKYFSNWIAMIFQEH